MAAGSIIVELLAKTGAFDTDTDRSSKAFQKRMKDIKKEAEVMGVAVGVAFTAVAAAATALVLSSIDTADELSKMSQKVGIATEELSALAYSAKLSDVNNEQLGSGLVKLARNISEAAQGTGDAAEAFDKLGIKVKDNDGRLRNTGTVLSELAGKFAGMEDSTEKTALAVAIFGKSGADMIPLLNSGSEGLAKMREEAMQLGVVISTETGKASEEFNDNLTRMGEAVRGVANRAAKELLPSMTSVTEILLEMAKDEQTVATVTDIVKGSLGLLLGVFQTIAVVGSDVGFVFLSVGREIGAWAAQLVALDRLDLKGFRAISDAVREDGERARAELDKFQARVMKLGLPSEQVAVDDEARRRLGHGIPEAKTRAPRLTGKAPKGAKGRDEDADFKAYMNQLEQQIQKVNELTAVEKLNDDIRRGHLTVTKDQREQLDILAKIVDKHKEWTDQMKLGRERAIEEGDAVNKANEAYQGRLSALLSATPSAALEQTRSDLQFLMDEFNRAGSELSKNPKLFAEAWEAAAERTSRPLNDIKLQLTETQELVLSAGEAGLRAFEDMAIGGGNLNDVLGDLLQTFARMVFQIGVMEPAMKQLRLLMSGGDTSGVPPNPFAAGSGGGIDWGSLLSKGASMLFGGFRAGGGDVEPGKAYIVGERGPEPFIPRTAGRVLPSSAMGSGAGIGDIKVINETTGRVDRASWNPREKALLLQEVRQMYAADAGDPSSPLQQSLQRSSNLRPRRF